MCLGVYCSAVVLLHAAADCCPPLTVLTLDWAMPTPSLPCRRATAGVGWRWSEPVVQPRLRPWGVWPGSKLVCLHHGPLCCAKSQTLEPMKFWTAALSSGSQVCFLSPTYSTNSYLLFYIDSFTCASLNCTLLMSCNLSQTVKCFCRVTKDLNDCSLRCKSILETSFMKSCLCLFDTFPNCELIC